MKESELWFYLWLSEWNICQWYLFKYCKFKYSSESLYAYQVVWDAFSVCFDFLTEIHKNLEKQWK